ncbi:MAG: carboxyl transferase domain-containing protein [Actinomycetota bacterium]
MARTARTTTRSARDLLDLVLDAGWEERDASLTASDPLGFPGYADRDGTRESVISADGTLGGLPIVGISFEFDVFGGSMGVSAGEKIARAFERAVERRAAVIALTASGGARMQEGMPALAQMAKTVLARRELTAAGLPFLAYLSDPTTGGVYASFASLADVLWAEPGATIGFAGPRVAEQVAPLDDESHTSEFSLENGLVDDIVPPADLRAAAGVFLRATTEPDDPATPKTAVDAAAGAATCWHVVELARHPGRPSGRAILDAISEVFVELRGDRAGVDDAGLATGVARIGGRRAGVLALDRTRPTPPAYRKAYRSLRFSGALGLPLVSIVDTPGADPSSASEAGGIARTISTAFRTVLEHPGPSVAVVSGEGGSGGGLALTVCDRVLVCENAIFSVIAPESAAAILRRDDVENVAQELRLTARDLVAFGLADEVIPEPPGGAHNDPDGFIHAIGEAVARTLHELATLPKEERLASRRKRWRESGNAFLTL